MHRRSRSALLPAIVFLLSLLASNPAGASETLDPQLFWRAPAESEIKAILATPDGGLIAFIYRFDQDPYLQRLERDGGIRWSLAVPGLGGSIRMARDPQGGSIVCSLSRGLTHVSENGQIDWELDPDGPALEAVWGLKSCDQILSRADGVLILGRAANGPEGSLGGVRMLKIGAAGTLDWVVETTGGIADDAAAVMTPLPGGDIELLLQIAPDSASATLFQGDRIGWLRRISSDGHWRPVSRMEREIPPSPEWHPVLEAESLTAQGYIRRVGNYANESGPSNAGGCGFLADEWSDDGMIRLLEFELGDTPPKGRELRKGDGKVAYLGQRDGRDLYLVQCGFHPRYKWLELVALDAGRSSRWYAFGAIEMVAFDMGPDRLFISAYAAAGSFEIQYVTLPTDLK